jgi:hypothetical protein
MCQLRNGYWNVCCIGRDLYGSCEFEVNDYCCKIVVLLSLIIVIFCLTVLVASALGDDYDIIQEEIIIKNTTLGFKKFWDTNL